MTTTQPRSHGMAEVWQVFAAFLKLGLTSFGGPAAHIGYFQQEFVERRRWLSNKRYAELVALCQFLPGPASSQLGFAPGLDRAGGRGAVAAWLAFTLPSAVLMVAFAFGAALLRGEVGRGALAGVEAVAVAVVAHAVVMLARTLTPDLKRIVIALVAMAFALCIPGSPGQIAAITVGGLIGLWWCRGPATHSAAVAGPLVRNLSKRAAVCCLAALAVLLVALPVLARFTGQPFLALADAFTRAGALVFGGGHVVLPLLQAEPWVASQVAPDALLAGFGAAQALPGPLFTYAAYLGAVGYPTAPLIAASIALVTVFVPGMLLLCGVLPFWNHVRQKPGVAAAIRGASAAVVGLLAAALISPLAAASLTGWASVSIALGAFAMLMLRLPPWLIVVCGAVAGALMGLGAAG